MRLGLTLAPHSTSALDHAIDLAVAAEQAGFETIYVPERHFDAAAGFANPYAVAAAISSRLQHAWLGVRPTLGLQHPLRLVEQSNLLDVLTHGRSIVVLGERSDDLQYQAFGLPTPRDGLWEDQLDKIVRAGSWQYREDGPPLEFTSGPYSARMAGRIMPVARRRPHPLMARETDSEVIVVDVARRGWPVQLRASELEQARRLTEVYRTELLSADHSPATVDECLRWLVVVVEVTPDSRESERARWRSQLTECGVAEIRLDPAPGASIEQLLHDLSGVA